MRHSLDVRELAHLPLRTSPNAVAAAEVHGAGGSPGPGCVPPPEALACAFSTPLLCYLAALLEGWLPQTSLSAAGCSLVLPVMKLTRTRRPMTEVASGEASQRNEKATALEVQ